MILTDTGPLVALIIETDPHRIRIEQAFAGVKDTMVTTVACLAEAFYFLGNAGGWRAQDALGEMLRTGLLAVHQTTEAMLLRAIEYMGRFRDQPCDFADATLLVAAEELGVRRVFTIDSHFYAYQLANGDHLDVVV